MKEQIRAIIENSCLFTQNSDLSGILSTIHQKSEIYSVTKVELDSLFDTYKLGVEFCGFRYMGKDKTCSYARVQQKTKNISGPDFTSNIVDQLLVFKQDRDDWKIWTMIILNIKYLE